MITKVYFTPEELGLTVAAVAALYADWYREDPGHRLTQEYGWLLAKLESIQARMAHGEEKRGEE